MKVGYNFKKGYPTRTVSVINNKEIETEEISEVEYIKDIIYKHEDLKEVYENKIKNSEIIDCEAISSASVITDQAILYVIAVVSNPARFERRYQLFNEFCVRMRKEPQVVLVTVELQQGSRPYITDATIRLRTEYEVWYKENLINIAVQHLPENWEYMAWIDSDISFQNINWARETIEQLQTYKVIQLFTHCIDLGMKGETLHVHTGIMYAYINGEIHSNHKFHGQYSKYFHVGYAFGIRRDAYNSIGQLPEFPILGSADNHLALALLGLVDGSLNRNLHPNYILLCRILQERCERHIKRDVGYIHGTILHNFHGNKADRKYQSRWNILVENQFDPLVDIYKDCNNLWVLNDNKPKLRDEIRRYFRERNEDCNTMPCDYQFKKAHWI